MALTVIPTKDFEELVKGTNEAYLKRAFSYADMREFYCGSYRDILDYVKTTNVQKIGIGSSRIAFFMPSGSISSDKSRPSCFKVAKNSKGVPQNNAEIKLFNEYGNKYQCFPEIYDYDKDNKFYIFAEVGHPIDKSFKEGCHQWIAEWDEAIKKIDGDCLPCKLGRRADTGIEDITQRIVGLCESIAIAKDALVKSTIDSLERTIGHIKKYDGMFSLVKFAANGGAKIINFSDFAYNLDNWALVLRDNEDVLLPIDYGFTWEVYNKYY